MSVLRWPLVFAVLSLVLPARADDWPVRRGPAREPLPYRYEPAVLRTIPKDILDDTSACVLYSGTTHLIEPDGTTEAISHEVTRLNSRRGVEKLGEYRAISFDPTYETLTLNVARVLKADGKIVPIEPRHVQLRDIGTDFQVYDQSKQLVISFPNLQVGDIYEVKWTIRGKSTEFDGHFFSRYTFGDDQLPVLRDEFRVQVPRNKTLKHATVNGDVALVVSESASGRFYHWTATDRRPLPRDEERPSKEELRLQVMVSTFPTWDAVGAWKQNRRKDCWTCTPEVRRIVEEVTRGKETPIEKAKALTYWVRRHVRYHSRGPGGLGYTPHMPQQVLANLYGDCKDQAQLLAVMLREVGLPVWLVTLGTTDDGQVLKDVPSPWGSHAILLTRIDGKDHWIDTTVSLAPWDFLPRSDRDRLTYVTRDAELKLVQTPGITPDDDRTEQTTHVAIQPDGTSRCKREMIYHGASAWSKRNRWLESPPGERRRNILADLRDAHATAQLTELKIDDEQLRDLDRPVRAEIEFEIPRHFPGDSAREGSLTDSPVWAWFLGYTLETDRGLPFVLPTPFESRHKYVVTIPPLLRFDGIPESKQVVSKWGAYKLEVHHDGKNPHRVELHMHMRLEKVRVEKSEFAEFLKFQEDVGKAYRVWVYLRPTANIADAPLLEKYLADHKQADPHTAKALARLYLDHDRPEDARRMLDRATPMTPRDRGLWELRIRASANVDDEERLYRAMVQQFSNDPRDVVALGAVCVRRENHGEAQQILAPLTKHSLAPVRGAAHYQLARSAYRQDNAAAALKHLQGALIADAGSLATPDALHFKARVHEKLGQLKEARQSLEAILDADPNSRDTMEYLVRLELQMGMKEAALDHLRRFTIAAGKDLSSLARAAELHFEMGRPDEAFELASRARDAGFPARAQRILGLVHFGRQEYLQAIFHLDRGDLDARALSALVQAHLRLGDLDAAQRRAETIARQHGQDKELLAQEKDVSRLIERRGKFLKQWDLPKEQEAAAYRVLNRVLCAERGLDERWPRAQVERLIRDAEDEGFECAPLLALRGFLAVEKGQLRKALADAETALKKSPQEGRAFLVRGRVRLEQGNLNGALSDLRRATELSLREDATVLHWLAAALLEAGRTPEAIETQRLALLLRPDDAELQAQLRHLERKAKESTDGPR